MKRLATLGALLALLVPVSPAVAQFAPGARSAGMGGGGMVNDTVCVTARVYTLVHEGGRLSTPLQSRARPEPCHRRARFSMVFRELLSTNDLGEGEDTCATPAVAGKHLYPRNDAGSLLYGSPHD